MTETQTDDGRLATYLANHPRMMGVLFTATLILTQAGTVLANNGAGTSGP